VIASVEVFQVDFVVEAWSDLKIERNLKLSMAFKPKKTNVPNKIINAAKLLMPIR